MRQMVLARPAVRGNPTTLFSALCRVGQPLGSCMQLTAGFLVLLSELGLAPNSDPPCMNTAQTCIPSLQTVILCFPLQPTTQTWCYPLGRSGAATLNALPLSYKIRPRGDQYQSENQSRLVRATARCGGSAARVHHNVVLLHHLGPV